MKKSISQGPDFIYWFQRNYTVIFISILFLYLLFAFLAPFMMHLGFSKAGNVIYSTYSKLCHQFAHRSWFLFGAQYFYPIESRELGNILSMDDVFGINANDLNNSRRIIGNELAGFKMAICQRDVMIYFALMLFAFIFHFSKKTIKKIPLWMWFALAVIPIAVDGIWQLFSTINVFNIPTHESTPLIRSVTGAMFGLFSGWYLLPAIQDTFNDDRDGRLIRK